MADDKPHINRETDTEDEDLDRQEDHLRAEAERPSRAGTDAEDFTDGGGEEPPPGAPTPDDPDAPEPAPNDAF